MNLYRTILYWLGFAENDTITAMLRRQKERIGAKKWAVITLVGILSVVGGLYSLSLHVLGVW